MAQRIYPLNLDTVGYPIFGPEDGTRFYGIKPYNSYTVSGVNKDGSAGYFAEMGTKDNDLYTVLSLAGAYKTQPAIANNANQDISVDLGAVCHQLYVDNTRNANPVFIEYADTAASNTSIQIFSGQKEIVAINTQKVHIFSATPTSVQIRGWV